MYISPREFKVANIPAFLIDKENASFAALQKLMSFNKFKKPLNAIITYAFLFINSINLLKHSRQHSKQQNMLFIKQLFPPYIYKL